MAKGVGSGRERSNGVNDKTAAYLVCSAKQEGAVAA